MKTILVPTDFSSAAQNAAEYAVCLAKEINAKVLLLHAYRVPVPATEVPIMMPTPEELQKENEDFLKKEAIRLKKKIGLDVQYKALMGFAVDEILEEEKNAYLVVMGITGSGKLSQALIGSISTAMIRKSEKPILIIPEKAEYKKPKKIVFACDYDSRTNINVLDVLKDFIKIFASKIFVLNVSQKKELVSVESGTKLEHKLNDVEHIYYFPENEDVVDGINEFVLAHHADMVAIIPHRYNLIERLFHKSVSKKMAFHTHVPLLALPDKHKTMAAYL